LKTYRVTSIFNFQPNIILPDLNDYDWGPYPRGKIGLYGLINSRNASLALQLVKEFLNHKSHKFKKIVEYAQEEYQVAKSFSINKQAALGLRLCNWPGKHFV
jgi:hypothetical protein